MPIDTRSKSKSEPEAAPPGNSRLAAERARNASPAAKAWLEENADSIRAWNEYVEREGLPLAKFRSF